MMPTPSLKATLKRFAWLWGALLGMALLPFLIMAFYPAVRLAPIPPTITIAPFDFPSFLWVVSDLTRRYSFWGGVLGGCGALLGMGDRSWKWRLLNLGVGVATMSYLLGGLWKFWQSFPRRDAMDNFYLALRAAECTPLVLISLALVFFALLLRSPRTSATKA